MLYGGLVDTFEKIVAPAYKPWLYCSGRWLDCHSGLSCYLPRVFSRSKQPGDWKQLMTSMGQILLSLPFVQRIRIMATLMIITCSIPPARLAPMLLELCCVKCLWQDWACLLCCLLLIISASFKYIKNLRSVGWCANLGNQNHWSQSIVTNHLEDDSW